MKEFIENTELILRLFQKNVVHQIIVIVIFAEYLKK